MSHTYMFVFVRTLRPPRTTRNATLFPYPTLFRSLDEAADKLVGIDAAAGVEEFDVDLIARLTRRYGEAAVLALALGAALGGGFDTVIERVADDVAQRIAHHLDHFAIKLDIGTLDRERYRLAETGSSITHHPRQCREQRVDFLHPGPRSEERRVGKEVVSTFRSWGSLYH